MEMRTKLGKSGRVLLPAALRRSLNLQPGDELIVKLEDNQLRLIPLRYAVAEAQERVRRYVPEGVTLVEVLLEERRAGAESV